MELIFEFQMNLVFLARLGEILQGDLEGIWT
jgi:hypothetical protein